MSGISPRQSTKVKWYLAPPFYDLLLAVLHTSRPFPRTSTHRIFLFTPSYGVLQKQGTLDERGAPIILHQRLSSRHSLTSSKRTSASVVVGSSGIQQPSPPRMTWGPPSEFALFYFVFSFRLVFSSAFRLLPRHLVCASKT